MLSCWSGQRLNGSRRTSRHQVGSMHAADTGFLKQCGRAVLQCSVLWEQLAAAGPFPVCSGCGDRAGQELGAVRAAECISLPACLPPCLPPSLPPSLSAQSSPACRYCSSLRAVCCPGFLQSSLVPTLCCAGWSCEEQCLWLQPLLAASCAVRLLSLKQTFV